MLDLVFYKCYNIVKRYIKVEVAYMKISVIQPRYSMNGGDVDSCFCELLAALDGCDSSLDVIVLPEYSDIPADAIGADFDLAIEKNNARLMDAVMKTAKRCSAYVFVNAMEKTPLGYRNTTHAISPEGECVGKYFKAHPAPSEVKDVSEGGHGLDVAYSYEPHEPYILELGGLRYAFLTCYDFYFYEYFPVIARCKPDIIIGCSLQRTDTHEALEIINRFLSYNTNAYLIRSSVSLGEDSPTCGSSMVVSPKGELLLNMKNEVGRGECEIDPHEKYFKPAGHGGALKAHFEYIEEGRRPWLYRNAGASVTLPESIMPYPRLCAHRGFSKALPENTMPAFGAAVALGAEEIEFDIWATKDGVLVSCHDATLERVSDGVGKIYEKTYAGLLELDFGAKHEERYRGLKIATFEEILKKFAARVIMNIHVKIWDMNMERDMLPEIVALIRKYDCEHHVYFMTTSDRMLKKAMEYAPDIPVCVGFDGNREDKMSMVNRAISLGAKKIQLFKPYFDEETVKAAKAAGILTNVFWSDDPEEAKAFREMGIDTILTNDYLKIKNALEVN